MTPLLRVVHLAVAAAAIGAATHQALFAWRPAGFARARRFSKLALGATLLAMVPGALLYPVYKVQVRAPFLDAHVPNAARLFDMKEHLVALALPLLVAAALLARAPAPEPRVRALHRACSTGAAALLWIGGLLAAGVGAVHGYR